MLGDKRSHSLFDEQPSPVSPPEGADQNEVHDISFSENTGRTLFSENKVAPRASDVFFAPKDQGLPFSEVLGQVQTYLSGTYASLITEGSDDAREQIKRRMARYLQDNRMAVDGMTQGYPVPPRGGAAHAPAEGCRSKKSSPYNTMKEDCP